MLGNSKASTSAKSPAWNRSLIAFSMLYPIFAAIVAINRIAEIRQDPTLIWLVLFIPLPSLAFLLLSKRWLYIFDSDDGFRVWIAWILAGLITATTIGLLFPRLEEGFAESINQFAGIWLIFVIGLFLLSSLSGSLELVPKLRQSNLLKAELLEKRDLAVAEQKGFLAKLHEIVSEVINPEIEQIKKVLVQLDGQVGGRRLISLMNRISLTSIELLRGSSRRLHEAESSILSTADSITGFKRLSLTIAQLGPPPLSSSLVLLVLSIFLRQGTCDLKVYFYDAFFVVFLLVMNLVAKSFSPFKCWGAACLVVFIIGAASTWRLLEFVPSLSCEVVDRSGSVLATAIFVSLSVLAGSAHVAFKVGSNEILRLNAEQIEQIWLQLASIQQNKDALRRNSRSILHSALQGRLASISLAIQLHLDSGGGRGKDNFDVLRHRLESLIKLANDDLVELLAGGQKVAKSVSESLAEIASQWAGLIDVEIHLDAQMTELLNSHLSMQQNLPEVLQDLINNANRHGQAKLVTLRIAEGVDGLNNATVLITAIDDGSSVSSPGAKGLGFQNVEELGGAWSIVKPAGGGALVTVHLPL